MSHLFCDLKQSPKNPSPFYFTSDQRLLFLNVFRTNQYCMLGKQSGDHQKVFLKWFWKAAGRHNYNKKAQKNSSVKADYICMEKILWTKNAMWEKSPLHNVYTLFFKKEIVFQAWPGCIPCFALHNKHLSYFKPNKLFKNIKAIHNLLSRLIRFTP